MVSSQQQLACTTPGNHIAPESIPLVIARHFPEARPTGQVLQLDDAVGFAIGGVGGFQLAGRDQARDTGIPLIIDLGVRGGHPEIGAAVAVQVAQNPHRVTRPIAIFAHKPERPRHSHQAVHIYGAVLGICFRQVFQRHHISVRRAFVTARIRRSDDQSGSTVAVQVSLGNAVAERRASAVADNFHGARLRRDPVQGHVSVRRSIGRVRRLKARSGEEIDRPGIPVPRVTVIPKRCANDQVRQAVSVHVAGAGGAISRSAIPPQLPRVGARRHVGQNDLAVHAAVKRVDMFEIGGGDHIDRSATRILIWRAYDYPAVASPRHRKRLQGSGVMADEGIGSHFRLFGIGIEHERRRVGLVHRPVPVNVAVRVVADAVPVGIRPLVRVVGETVGVVADSVAVGVHRFGRVFRERVGVVAHPVAVGVRAFPGVEGKGV